MPPKKKKKKTKKQLEEERRREEEEARLRLEEEERQRRIAEEKERKRREEEEKKKKEEDERRRKEEEARLDVELEEYVDQRDIIRQKKERTLRLLEEEREWKKAVSCCRLPDPQDERDLNAYLSLWLEEELSTLSGTLESCVECVQVLDRLQIVRGQVKTEANDEEGKKKYTFLNDMERQLVTQLLNTTDRITAETLSRLEEFTPSESANKNGMTIVMLKDRIKYALWANVQKNPRTRVIDFGDAKGSTELPKTLALANIAVRHLFLPIDTMSMFAKKDEKHWSILGGVHYVELLALPPQGRETQGWILRQASLHSDAVVRVPYPVHSSEGMQHSATQLRMIFTIPEDVLIRTETPVIGIWDEENSQWTRDNITEISLLPDGKQVMFHSVRFGAFAILHERTFDIPYSSWTLAPYFENGQRGVLMSIVGRRRWCDSDREVEILITEKGCMLRRPNDVIFKESRSKFQEPFSLLQELSRAGINLLLNTSDQHAVSEVSVKVKELEDFAYDQMSMMASFIGITRSKWNQVTEDSIGVVRLAKSISQPSVSSTGEVTPYEIDPERGEWELFEFYPNKVGYVASLEDDEDYSHDPPENMVTHLNAHIALSARFSSDMLDQWMRTIDFRVVEYTRVLLSLVQPLSWG